MLFDLPSIAPHMLGMFMIALACVPLVFVWQDRRRRQADRDRLAMLQREARVAAKLRARGPVGDERVFEDWLGETRR